MANTYVITPANSEERLATVRSSSFDPWEAWEEFHELHGDLAVYDLTDSMRPVCYIGTTYDHDPHGATLAELARPKVVSA